MGTPAVSHDGEQLWEEAFDGSQLLTREQVSPEPGPRPNLCRVLCGAPNVASHSLNLPPRPQGATDGSLACGCPVGRQEDWVSAGGAWRRAAPGLRAPGCRRTWVGPGRGSYLAPTRWLPDGGGDGDLHGEFPKPLGQCASVRIRPVKSRGSKGSGLPRDTAGRERCPEWVGVTGSGVPPSPSLLTPCSGPSGLP